LCKAYSGFSPVYPLGSRSHNSSFNHIDTNTDIPLTNQNSLYQALSREVEELRSSNDTRGFVRVAFAKGLKPPKDLADADGIMDWLDQRGIIDMEWQVVRELMESARNLEMAARRGEDDIHIT
jgi:hypothetical protein